MEKFLVIALFFLLFIMPTFSCSSEAPPAGPAVDAIETLNAALLDCMKRGEELGYAGRYALLEPVMAQYFSFHYMVRKSCGSFWQDMTVNQQQQVLKKYITWSVGKYAERFKTYKGQAFKVISAEPVRNKYMMVFSRIEKTDKTDREFKYILLESDGVWRIVDIQVEGVSQLSLTRSQFKSVLKDQGASGLLKVLVEKISKLDQGNTE